MNLFKQFEDIVNSSKSFDEALKRTREVKNVPAEVAEAFYKKYYNDNTPESAFKTFYNEVKGETE